MQVNGWRKMMRMVWAARFKMIASDVCELRHCMAGTTADPKQDKNVQ